MPPKHNLQVSSKTGKGERSSKTDKGERSSKTDKGEQSGKTDKGEGSSETDNYHARKHRDLSSALLFLPPALVGVDLQLVVQNLLCGLSDRHKAQWFQSAFSISRLPWHSVAKLWWTNMTRVSHVEADGDSPDGPLPVRAYTRSVVADLSSEIIPSEEFWRMLWAWLPDWVISEQPECLFRASKDGYK